METTRTHRQDIDGLRAIAVALVVLYHYGVAPFSGGYVGVDVFFVISGYVITAKVRRELAAGTFTLHQFYAGRIRRILPALAFMTIASLIAGWVLLMPADYRELGYQSAFGAVGLSNFYFLENSGYFSRASDLLPLLHTWSLGVEEQFYLVWPALLIFSARSGLGTRGAVGVLFSLLLGSFVLSAMTVHTNQPAAFYLLHSRAWELALGGLLTYAPALKRGALANLAGLSLVALSALLLQERSAFPGLLAIPVCLGAALLIWPKGRLDPISNVLSSWPFVQVGLLSYSLYLWHWPILVFYRHINFEQDPTLGWKLALIAVSMAAAWFSYRVVEQPFRANNSLRKVAVPGPVAASLLIALTGIGVAAASGVPARIPPVALSVAQGAMDISPHRAECHRPVALSDAPIADSCRLGAPHIIPTSIIWGDSHAVELGEALGELASNRGTALLSVTQSSCPPAVGFERRDSPKCDEHNQAVLDHLLATAAIKTVFLAGRYERALREDEQGLTSALRRTIDALLVAGKEVVIFGPVPTRDISMPLVGSRMMMHNENNVLTIDRDDYNTANDAVLEFITEQRARPGVSVFDTAAALCDDNACRTIVNGHSLYFDSHHLSMFGARWVASKIPSYLLPWHP